MVVSFKLFMFYHDEKNKHMDGPRDYYTKWSKSERERQIPYDFTHMCNLKNNKWTKKTQMES